MSRVESGLGTACGDQDASLWGSRRQGVALSVVVVLDDRKRLQTLRQRLEASDPAPAAIVAIGSGETDLAQVERLDPSTGRRKRQRLMVRWLLPFGFLAGLTFTQITDLHTFSALGPWGEPLIGGLLGLGSGWMGSFAAAASVASEEDDRIRILRNRLQEGNWLLLVDPAPGSEPPWSLIQQARPKAVVRLGES